MSTPVIDPNPPSNQRGNIAFFQHETEGWIGYDVNTLAILQGQGGVKHLNPISLPEKFVGTKQPFVSTCSEPREGNRGCPKWAGCPFKKYPYVGPANLIMRHHGAVSYQICFNFYEDTRFGRPISQNHDGLDGWVPDVTRTTIDVLGTVPIQNKFGQNVGRKQGVWQMQIRNLLPPWWGLLKKQGLPLPEAAKLYPELVPADEPAEESSEQPSSPPRSRRASRGGRKGRTATAKES